MVQASESTVAVVVSNRSLCVYVYVCMCMCVCVRECVCLCVCECMWVCTLKAAGHGLLCSVSVCLYSNTHIQIKYLHLQILCWNSICISAVLVNKLLKQFSSTRIRNAWFWIFLKLEVHYGLFPLFWINTIKCKMYQVLIFSILYIWHKGLTCCLGESPCHFLTAFTSLS